MARNYPLYLGPGTSKYGYIGIGKYGFFQYGWNYPPPTPENLTVLGGPIIVDETPYFSWTNPTFSWEVPYGDGDPLFYEIQIAFNDPTFTTLDADTNEFQSAERFYHLAPEFTLQKEGTYYARIRSTDGFTYSDWSDSLKFVLFLFNAYPPTIDPVTSPADAFWQVVTGTKTSGAYVFIRNNGGTYVQAAYPNGVPGGRWSYNVPLVPGTNYIEVIAAVTTDISNATSLPVAATIYLIVSVPEIYNVWNCFDEFGLLLGLPRIPGERNKQYKGRLLDVYQNKANSTHIGLINGISRELGLTSASVEVERLSDLMDPSYPGNLLNDDGNALGTRLVDYANEVYDHNPVFFGNIICDESYWDGVDEETNGYNFLPHIWDPSASGIYEKWQGGGIGDRNDLWVDDPIEVWNVGISGYSWYLPVHTGFFYSVYPSGVLII